MFGSYYRPDPTQIFFCNQILKWLDFNYLFLKKKLSRHLSYLDRINQVTCQYEVILQSFIYLFLKVINVSLSLTHLGLN